MATVSVNFKTRTQLQPWQLTVFYYEEAVSVIS